MATFELGTTSYSYLWTASFEDALRELADQGFAQLELMACSPHPDRAEGQERQLEAFARLAGEVGIDIVGVNPPGLDLNLISPDRSFRHLSLQRYRDAITASSLLGATYLVIVAGRRHPLLPAPLDITTGWLREALEVLVPEAAEEGIELVLENTPSNFLDTGKELKDFLDGLGAPDGVGICYDVANGFMVEDVATALREVRGQVRVVHLSDTTKQSWRHDPLGAGDVDFQMVGKVLSEEPPAFVMLETIHQDEIAAGLEDDLARLEAAGWDIGRRP